MPLHWTCPGSGQNAVHWPARQLCVGEQAVPQVPQLLRSMFRSTHEPLQLVSGGGQVVAQVPRAQTWLEPQGRPQEPQFATSVFKSTQRPLQVVSGGGQTQLPTAQS